MSNTAEQLGAALQKHEGRADELRATIAELEQREDAALTADLHAAPSSNPLANLTSETAKVRRAKEKAARELEGLERDLLPRLRAEHSRASREAAEAFYQEQRAKLQRVNAQAPAAWAKVAGAFAAFQEAFEESTATLAVERARIEAEAMTVLDSWADLREAFRLEVQASAPDVLPGNLSVALERLRVAHGIAAETGPRTVYRTDPDWSPPFAA